MGIVHIILMIGETVRKILSKFWEEECANFEGTYDPGGDRIAVWDMRSGCCIMVLGYDLSFIDSQIMCLVLHLCLVRVCHQYRGV